MKDIETRYKTIEPLSDLIIFGIALAATYIGVEIFRRWSLRADLLDVPNDRSSHDSPTPRGGGLIIAAITLLLYSYITVFLTNNFNWAFLMAGALITLVGWLDDLYSLSFTARFVVQAAMALIIVFGMGFWQEVYLPGFGFSVHLGNVGAVLTFVWIVWMVNAYNFMDGIDGLAGAQAVLAGFGWLVFGYALGYQSIYLFGGVVAFSSMGFLIHNWSPAKIFLGDVGSSFLGFALAVIPLMIDDGEHQGSAALLLPAAAVFVWFFIFDAGFTRLRRVLRGENVLIAHREHLYQRMVLSGMAHSSVSLMYAAFMGLVILCFFAATLFRGTWEYLTLFTIVLLSATLVFLGRRKKV